MMDINYKIHPDASTRAKGVAPAFFKRVHDKFAGKFSYSKSEYLSSNKDKILVTCSIHGDFPITPNAHENSKDGGCMGCRKQTLRGKFGLSRDEFIQRCKEVHSDYTYGSTVYKNMQTKITVTCKRHGDFEISPNNFLKGYGCTACKGYVDSHISFIEKARKIHGSEYDYAKTVWESATKRVTITCPEHGDFTQTPAVHINNKSGCKKCKGFSVHNTETFIEKAREKHGDRYDYTQAVYERHNKPVLIICPIHGEFEQYPNTHCSNRDVIGCPLCSRRGPSQGEIEISDFIKGLGVTVIRNSRSLIPPKEIDIYLPEFGIAIEYCGLYWHSTEVKSDSQYHRNKYLECKNKGIHLITIFEDEWVHRGDVVKSVLNNMLNRNNKRIGARKLTVSPISKDVCKPFMDQHHLQGFVSGSTYLGAFHGDTLVSVMIFGNPTRQKTEGVELKRFVTDGGNYAGVASKLFAYFIREYNPSRVVSFSDHRWFEGTMYEKLGFTAEATLPPDYSYCRGTQRFHKSGFRKSAIAKKFPDIYDPNITEQTMMKMTPYNRIYDCGKTRWVWRERAP